MSDQPSAPANGRASTGAALVGLDVGGLARWLARARPDLLAHAGDPLDVSLITHGRSNLTYRVHGTTRPLVVRRPPLGHVLTSAHDVGREHRVVAALEGTAVPVPATVALVDDARAGEVTGTPFFVMEEAPGRVMITRADNEGLTPTGLGVLGTALAETLADLHAVDPASVGLGDLGRAQGYLRRQMATWRRQYDASRSREVVDLDALQDTLDATVPEEAGAVRPALVHGDYRLDNVLVVGGGDAPRISAVLDWEMATLGDPLVDLGLLGLYWEIADLPPQAAALARSAVDPDAGYPTFEELVEAYARRTAGGPGAGGPPGRAGPSGPADLSELSWYRAFAAYKLAVIVEQIHFRRRAGSGLGGGAEDLGALVAPVAALGRALAAGPG